MIERALWITGTLLLSIFFGHLALAEYHRVNEIAAFRALAVSAEDFLPAETSAWQLNIHAADQSLWSAGRIASFAAGLEQETIAVLALFSIPRLGLEVPMYDGASALHLNRGVARIDGTAMPGATTTVEALPATASSMPMFGLLGGMALCAAFLLRIFRRR